MNGTAPPITGADLLSTEHLGEFLAVLALGMVLGVLAVVAVLSWLVDDSAPADADQLTERMAPLPVADLPRREWQL